MRKDGVLVPIADGALTPDHTARLAKEVLPAERWAIFEQRNDLDFSFNWLGRARFRVSARPGKAGGNHRSILQTGCYRNNIATLKIDWYSAAHHFKEYPRPTRIAEMFENAELLGKWAPDEAHALARLHL